MPPPEPIAEELRRLNHQVLDKDEDGIEVRLQVFEDGATFVHSGDPARDPDDRGYWAATKLPGNSKPFHAFQVARELVSEVGEAVLRRQQGYGHIGLRRGEPVPEALREERRKADKGHNVANLEARRTAFQEKRERRVEGLRADGERHLKRHAARRRWRAARADTIPRRSSNDEVLGGGAPPAAGSEATVPVTSSVTTTANDTSVEPRGGEDALRTLEVGRTHFDNGLKFHRYDGSLSITDMTHAGKRGKVVDETWVNAGNVSKDLQNEVLNAAFDAALGWAYKEAIANVKRVLSELEKEHPGAALYRVSDRTYRGVDVEPPATTIEIENTFPDGLIVRVTASPYTFHVTKSVLLSSSKPNAPPHQQLRDDINYWSENKREAVEFYGWLRANMERASRMRMEEFTTLWRSMGIRYDSH